jgi:hypothetical protein
MNGRVHVVTLSRARLAGKVSPQLGASCCTDNSDNQRFRTGVVRNAVTDYLRNRRIYT